MPQHSEAVRYSFSDVGLHRLARVDVGKDIAIAKATALIYRAAVPKTPVITQTSKDALAALISMSADSATTNKTYSRVLVLEFKVW